MQMNHRPTQPTLWLSNGIEQPVLFPSEIFHQFDGFVLFFGGLTEVSH